MILFPLTFRPKSRTLAQYVFALLMILSIRFLGLFTHFLAEFWFPMIWFEYRFPYINDGVGLDPSIIEVHSESQSILELEFEGSESFGLESCAICLEEYESNHEVRRLPCGHVFHTECVDIWFDSSINCPLCKTSIIERI
eukprot:UN22637